MKMAKNLQSGILVEQLIDELRNVLLRWNTSSLIGKMIIVFRDNSKPEINYYPQVTMTSITTHVLSDMPPDLTQKHINVNLSNRLDSDSNIHELSRQPCDPLFPRPTKRCSQVDDPAFRNDNSQQDAFDNPRLMSHTSSPVSSRKQRFYHHALSVSLQSGPSAARGSVSTDYNGSSMSKVSLPPFEKIMQAKSSHSVQSRLRDPDKEYNNCPNSGVQTLPQTCFNDVKPPHGRHDVTVIVECSPTRKTHIDDDVTVSEGIASKYHCIRDEEMNTNFKLSKPSFQDLNSFNEETKSLNSVDNVNNSAIPHHKLPQRQSLDDVITHVKSTGNSMHSNFSNHAFDKNETCNENQDMPLIEFADGTITTDDIVKLSQTELVRIVTKVLTSHGNPVKELKSTLLSNNTRNAFPHEHEDFSSHLKGRNSITECVSSKMSTSDQTVIENHSSFKSPSLTAIVSEEPHLNGVKKEVMNIDIIQMAADKNISEINQLEMSTRYSDSGQALSQSKDNQNIKPLKKRTPLCSNFRSELNVKSLSKDRRQGDLETSTQPLDQTDIGDSLPLGRKQRSAVKLEKNVKKSSFCCKICLSHFTSRQDYRQHLRSHNGSFKCTVCGKIMKTKDSLYHHQRGLHSKEKPYHCKECGIAFNFYHSYKLHLQRHKGERPHKCKYCEKSYLTFNHLKEHVQAIHSNSCIVCHVCGKKFSYNSALKLHLRRHSGEAPYKCSLCPKKFSTKQSLKIHAASHIKERNFQCETCGKCFKTEYSRNFHSRKHKKLSKRFMCDVCGKTFLYKCILDSHVQIHSKIRPYICTTCDKTFKSKASLYTHKYNVHKEGLTFSCSICNKSFKTKSCLTAHVKRHQNDNIHTCSTCGATFPDKGGLNKHMKTIHLPHKCFICKICGKTGTRADNMRTHVKSHKNEIAISTNPMDFIIQELATDRLTDFQNQMVNIRQRSREPKHRSTRKLYPTIQTPHQNRWIQPCPTSVKDVHKPDTRSQATSLSISALPLLSQGSASRSNTYAKLQMEDSSAMLPHIPKDFDTYNLPNDQSKSTQYLTYFCPSDIPGGNKGVDGSSSGGNTNNLTLPSGPLTTLLSTINVTQEAETHPPYSFILSHSTRSYQASSGNFHASQPIMPQPVESLPAPSYGMNHEKTMTTLHNVVLGIPTSMDESQMTNS